MESIPVRHVLSGAVWVDTEQGGCWMLECACTWRSEPTGSLKRLKQTGHEHLKTGTSQAA